MALLLRLADTFVFWISLGALHFLEAINSDSEIVRGLASLALVKDVDL